MAETAAAASQADSPALGPGDILAGAILGGTTAVGLQAAGIDLGTLFSDNNLEQAVREEATERVKENPRLLEGATEEEIESIIPEGWIAAETHEGGGVRYIDPATLDSIRVMPGNPNDRSDNPVKRGPYARVSSHGHRSEPIPLNGNPTLQ